MTMSRHEPFEELISASLTGDLTARERQRLDAHLDGCAACRATLAAFAEQRRIMGGLRHVAPPRDLGARVRTGIERGRFAARPWWRRPAVLFTTAGGSLAVVAGALLALVLMNGATDEPQVGQDQSPSPSTPVVAPSDEPRTTLPPIPTPTPDASPAETQAPPPSTAPSPTPSSPPVAPEPDMYLALTGPFDNQLLTVRDGSTDGLVTEVPEEPRAPIAAQLSPDGTWLAYIVNLGPSGRLEVRATQVSPDGDGDAGIGTTVTLGEGIAGSPFLEQLSWSVDGRHLAYTLADPAGGGTDVWIFQPDPGRTWQLTDVGDAYAASWTFDEAHTSLLWVSRAGESPRSFLVAPGKAGDAPVDPSDSPYPHAENVFQPLVSPDGAFVIYWVGRMERSGDEWLFSEGAAPWLAENRGDGQGGFQFAGSRELFSDLSIGRSAFASAAITWGSDGDAYAVWAASWTGVPQDEGDPYPDASRVYFGHATDPRGLTQRHAIDRADIPDGMVVVDVKVSPTGRHLVITALEPVGGVFDAPRAELRLVTRNTGAVADEVRVIGAAADGWFGPAAFDAIPDASPQP